MGRLKPYIPRQDGVNPPLHHYSKQKNLHDDSYVVEDVLDHEYRCKVRGKTKKSKQPFEGGKPWWRVKYRGSDRPEWHDVTAFLHDINKDWLDYNHGTTSRYPLIPSEKFSCGWTDRSAVLMPGLRVSINWPAWLPL